MINLLSHLCLICSFLLMMSVIKGKSEDTFPKISSASIYESSNRKGPSVTFVDDMEYWSDFRLLFAKRKNSNNTEIKKPSTICVRGAWLVYNQPDFRTSSTRDVHLFSGNENCVQPINMTLIQSMQPIGPYKFKKDSITLFEKNNFGSFGLSYFPEKTQIRTIRKNWLPTLESLVTMGKSSWTLLDYEGRAFCVKPVSSFKNPICLAPDLDEFDFPKDIMFFAVISSCGNTKNKKDNSDNSYTQTIELKNCKEFGSPKLEDISPSADQKVKNANGEGSDINCKKSSDNYYEGQINEEMIKKFARLRFTHDFGSSEQLLWPERKQDIWKTEIFDTIFDILIATIPPDMIPIHYIHLIREFTIFHLNASWKSGGSNGTSDFGDNEEIQTVTRNLNQCLDVAVEAESSIQNAIMSSYQKIQEPSQLQFGIYTEFRPDLKLDPVIEYTWLCINYVFALCHHFHDYNINFWTDYTNVIRELYFIPLASRWKTPKEISPKSFAAILGGFGVQNQFNKMAFATSIVFDMIPNLPSIERGFIR